MSDKTSEELQTARSKFLADLNALLAGTNDLDRQNAAMWLCQSTYHFARLQRMHPNDTWSTEEEERFKTQFVPGTIAFAVELRGLCSVLRAVNLYTVKLYLSAFEFVRKDLLRLYEKKHGAVQDEKLREAIETLQDRQFFLKKQLHEWRYDADTKHPYEWEKPSLEGVPDRHKWWKQGFAMPSSFSSDSDSDFD